MSRLSLEAFEVIRFPFVGSPSEAKCFLRAPVQSTHSLRHSGYESPVVSRRIESEE